MEDLDRRIETLALWMAEAERLVVFTRAGISTDSGLPDSRGPDGAWTRQEKGLPPKDPKLDWTKTSPSEAHRAIVDLQEMGKLDFLVSQNIDDLHRSSGFHPEILAELHGNLARVRCVDCEETHPRSYAFERCPCAGDLESSLVVTPAATVPAVAVEAGARLVILNRGETPLDGAAQLRFEEANGEVLPPAVRKLGERTGDRAGSVGPSTGPHGG